MLYGSNEINIIRAQPVADTWVDYVPPPATPTPASDPATAGIVAGINPLDVASATYGKVIPLVVGGAPRIGGYIIYGPKFATTSGLSYVSFGVSFGLQADPEGERELWEIRMDGVKVWSVEDGALIDGLTFRFTEGTEVQEPDAMLIADYGDAAPAFRSQCCIFFQSLPIARFDNHVPFVSAVIADVTDGADPTDGILLGDALERLAASAYVGLDIDSFETTGITTIVLALIDAERGSFMDLLLRLARLFPLDVVQTDKLRVIERSSISADIVLNENRIVGGANAIQIQRQPETDVAQELEFTYIDIDRDYEYTPQKARRPSDPVALTASRGKETINLPIVTTASNALSWVTQRKYTDEVARQSVAFTALPYGMEIDPGTMVAVKLDLSTYVIRIAETLHEARGTVKCVGAPVLRCSVSSIDDGPEIGDVGGDVIPMFLVGGGASGDQELMSSLDGITWVSRSSLPATGGHWIDSNDKDESLFIVVGQSDSGPTPTLSTSPDGVTWTERVIAAPATTGALYSVNCDGSLCVAAGFDTLDAISGPVILTSPDGVTWTQRTVPVADVSLYGVTFGSSIYLAVGADSALGTTPIVVTSSDGITWTQRTPDPSTNAGLYFATSNGSVFVAVGQDTMAGTALTSTSSDGITWTQRSNPSISSSYLNSVRWAPEVGLFVAVGQVNTGSFAPLILTSPTGTTWTQQSISGADCVLYDVSSNAGLLVAVGENIVSSENVIYTSPNGVAWTARTPAASSGKLYTVTGRG